MTVIKRPHWPAHFRSALRYAPFYSTVTPADLTAADQRASSLAR